MYLSSAVSRSAPDIDYLAGVRSGDFDELTSEWLRCCILVALVPGFPNNAILFSRARLRTRAPFTALGEVLAPV